MKPGRCALLVSLLLIAQPALAQTQSEVLDCMRANIPKSVQIKDVELLAIDRVGGKREMRGRLYGVRENDRLRAMIKIAAPSDLAGAAYLLREKEGGDEMYVYVPALQKVRRITGAGVDGALWGTDISYGDIKQINNAFSGGDVRLEGAGEHAGRSVHHLAMTPVAAEGSRFTEIKVWVDTKSCVALRADFLEGSTVRKRMEADPASLRQAGSHWYAGQVQMSDLTEGTTTRLRVLGVSSDVNLSGRFFNPNTFHLGS